MNIISCVHIGLVISVFAHVKRTGGGDGGESLLLGEGARGDFFFSERESGGLLSLNIP